MEMLLELFASICPLPDKLVAYLKDHLKKKQIKSEDYFLKENEISHRIYFLEEGLVRSCQMLGGKEVTIRFNRPGDIFGGMPSFIRQKPSYDIIQALKDTTAWGITHDEYVYLLKEFQAFRDIRGVIQEKYSLIAWDMVRFFQFPSTEEKYAYLVTEMPDYLSSIPQKYLYSYLGVCKATFQKMRKDYMAKHKKR